MVYNRVAVQTCLSLLIVVGIVRGDDSKTQERTQVHGIEIWLGTNRVTPPRTTDHSTPRLIEHVMTEQAVALQSRGSDSPQKTEQAFKPVRSHAPEARPSGNRGNQESQARRTSETIPVWRLPTRPGGSGVETRLSAVAPSELAEPAITIRALAVSEIGDLPTAEPSGAIGEAVRLLNESLELNQQAISILKSLHQDIDCVGCSFEQTVKTQPVQTLVPSASMVRTTNVPARVISMLLTDSPPPDTYPTRRDQREAEMKRQETVSDTETSLQNSGEDVGLQFMTFSPPVLRQPGLREVAVLVVALLMAVAMLEGISRAWRGRSGWPLWSLRQPGAEWRGADDKRRDEAKFDTVGGASDLVAAVIAQNVRLRRHLVEV